VVRAVTVVVMFGVILLLSIGIREYSAERLLVAGLEAADHGDMNDSAEMLDLAQSRHPSPTIAFHRGTQGLLRGDLETALESLEYAAWLLPYSEVHANYGLALCQVGESEAALETLELATRLDPTNQRAHQALGECRRAVESDVP